jgi:predicted PurR-regulated permease PerM
MQKNRSTSRSGHAMSDARRLELPWGTLARIALVAGLVWAWLKLWPLAMVLCVALVLAVTFDPPIAWLEKHRFPRWASVIVLGLSLLGATALLVAFVIPPLAEQTKSLVAHLRDLQNQVYHLTPASLRPLVKGRLDEAMSVSSSQAGKAALAIGGAAVSALTYFILGFILTLYLVAEGRRVYAWAVAYVPRAKRQRLVETNEEMSRVVFAYIAGQVLTSVICAAYAFGVLALLHVPAALILALVAGVFDILPILGFIIAVVPALVMALSVSPLTAAAVFGLYLLYHAIENYLIVPRVYGNRLRLSTLSVVIALAVGGELAGVVGAVLVLPLVAVFPIVERYWLVDHVGAEAVDDHRALDEAPGDEAVIRRVISGNDAD